jgi:hypothetical protein
MFAEVFLKNCAPGLTRKAVYATLATQSQLNQKKNTMNHSTFGPWTFDFDGYVSAPGGLICEVMKSATDRETEANGRLIASAPDMLAALERLTHPMADDEDLANAHAVIARALGTKLAKV